MSIGELLIVQNIVRNGSLWSSIVFEKEVISHKNNKRLLARSLLFLSESTQIRPLRVFFLSSFSHNFDDQLSSNYHRLVILCLYWYTPSEKTGLWQLPNDFSAFKWGRSPRSKLVGMSRIPVTNCTCEMVIWLFVCFSFWYKALLICA